MNIGDLREWLTTLPEEFDDMQLVFRKLGHLTNDSDPNDGEDGNYHYALDAPIVAVSIDTENDECCFFDKESADFKDSLELDDNN